MASGETTTTVECPECREPLDVPVRARHLTKVEVAVHVDLDPVREHIASHQAAFTMELPPTAR